MLEPKPLFPPGPEISGPLDPRILAWEIARTQAVVESHEAWLQQIQDRPHLPALKGVPWLRLLGLLGLLIAGLLGHISPQDARTMAFKLLGVLWTG